MVNWQKMGSKSEWLESALPIRRRRSRRAVFPFMSCFEMYIEMIYMQRNEQTDFRIQRIGCECGRVQFLQNLQVDEGAAVQQYLLHDVCLVVFGFCIHYRLRVKGTSIDNFQTTENLIRHTHLKCIEQRIVAFLLFSTIRSDTGVVRTNWEGTETHRESLFRRRRLSEVHCPGRPLAAAPSCSRKRIVLEERNRSPTRREKSTFRFAVFQTLNENN